MKRYITIVGLILVLLFLPTLKSDAVGPGAVLFSTFVRAGVVWVQHLWRNTMFRQVLTSAAAHLAAGTAFYVTYKLQNPAPTGEQYIEVELKGPIAEQVQSRVNEEKAKIAEQPVGPCFKWFPGVPPFWHNQCSYTVVLTQVSSIHPYRWTQVIPPGGMGAVWGSVESIVASPTPSQVVDHDITNEYELAKRYMDTFGRSLTDPFRARLVSSPRTGGNNITLPVDGEDIKSGQDSGGGGLGQYQSGQGYYPGGQPITPMEPSTQGEPEETGPPVTSPTYDSTLPGEIPLEDNIPKKVLGFLSSNPILSIISGSRIQVSDSLCNLNAQVYGNTLSFSFCEFAWIFQIMGTVVLSVATLYSFFIAFGVG